jgi:hypothetical protein
MLPFACVFARTVAADPAADPLLPRRHLIESVSAADAQISHSPFHQTLDEGTGFDSSHLQIEFLYSSIR